MIKIKFTVCYGFLHFSQKGVKTGKCVDADRKPFGKVCEIYAWCPVEIDELPMPGYNLRCVKQTFMRSKSSSKSLCLSHGIPHKPKVALTI